MASVSPASLELIRQLIAFPTVSRDTNLDLIHHVRDYLAGFGVVSELTFDNDRRKANLFATLGRTDRGGYCLSGHTDVVPVDGQDWDIDPFTATERDGRLYGRGTCDMKGFIGLALALVPEILARDPAVPIHLALTYDEEVGCLGVRPLIRRLAERDIRPIACVVGEPTEMRPVTAHKGKMNLRCHVQGHPCHSALAHEGVNAIEYAAELIVFLRGMAERRRRKGPFDQGYEPPFTTIHTGTIAGGTVLNIVPEDCSFDFEFRNLPEESHDHLLREVKERAAELEPAMHAIDPATGFRFEIVNASPALSMGETEPATLLVKSLTGANASGKVSFGTEAGHYQQAGIPAIVCGPGDIAQAHKPNEFVALDQLARCSTFLQRLLDRACLG